MRETQDTSLSRYEHVELLFFEDDPPYEVINCRQDATAFKLKMSSTDDPPHEALGCRPFLTGRASLLMA